MKGSGRSLIFQVIMAMVVIGIVSFFTPGIRVVGGIWTLFLTAIAIGIIQWVLSSAFGIERSPIRKGISGFLTTALILFLAGKFVNGLQVTLLGALIGALVLGIVEGLIPAGVFRD